MNASWLHQLLAALPSYEVAGSTRGVKATKGRPWQWETWEVCHRAGWINTPGSLMTHPQHIHHWPTITCYVNPFLSAMTHCCLPCQPTVIHHINLLLSATSTCCYPPHQPTVICCIDPLLPTMSTLCCLPCRPMPVANSSCHSHWQTVPPLYSKCINPPLH